MRNDYAGDSSSAGDTHISPAVGRDLRRIELHRPVSAGRPRPFPGNSSAAGNQIAQLDKKHISAHRQFCRHLAGRRCLRPFRPGGTLSGKWNLIQPFSNSRGLHRIPLSGGRAAAVTLPLSAADKTSDQRAAHLYSQQPRPQPAADLLQLRKQPVSAGNTGSALSAGAALRVRPPSVRNRAGPASGRRGGRGSVIRILAGPPAVQPQLAVLGSGPAGTSADSTVAPGFAGVHVDRAASRRGGNRSSTSNYHYLALPPYSPLGPGENIRYYGIDGLLLRAARICSRRSTD